MHVQTYDKLIRDRIPEIIERSGKTCVCETLTEGEYLRRLNEKLLEETREYLESGELEELADICEVLRAITEAKGLTPEALERARAEKRAARGGFEKRLLLKTVLTPEER